ncbi:MAG: tetratricopeptide repeat protein [Nitrospirae bacterium]|nr:tetratricopeptide repeat protein [Nitrospirota bacterium]
MQSINAGPRISEQLYGKALQALDDGNWLKALQYVKSVCEKSPQEPKFYHLLAELYLQHQHLDAAEIILKKALELDGGDIETLYLLGNTYLMKEDYRRALKLYLYLEKAMEDPYPELFFQIALAYYYEKENKKALRYLEETLLEDPSFVEAYELMGNLYLEENNLEKAKWALLELLELEPDHLQARKMMGKICSKETQSRKSLTVVSRCPESM